MARTIHVAWHILKQAKKCHPALCSEGGKVEIFGELRFWPLQAPRGAQNKSAVLTVACEALRYQPCPCLSDLISCCLPGTITLENLFFCVYASSFQILHNSFPHFLPRPVYWKLSSTPSPFPVLIPTPLSTHTHEWKLHEGREGRCSISFTDALHKPRLGPGTRQGLRNVDQMNEPH